MSRLTNQLTVTIAGLRGPGLSSGDLTQLEGAKNEALGAATRAETAANSLATQSGDVAQSKTQLAGYTVSTAYGAAAGTVTGTHGADRLARGGYAPFVADGVLETNIIYDGRTAGPGLILILERTALTNTTIKGIYPVTFAVGNGLSVSLPNEVLVKQGQELWWMSGSGGAQLAGGQSGYRWNNASPTSSPAVGYQSGAVTASSQASALRYTLRTATTVKADIANTQAQLAASTALASATAAIAIRTARDIDAIRATAGIVADYDVNARAKAASTAATAAGSPLTSGRLNRLSRLWDRLDKAGISSALRGLWAMGTDKAQSKINLVAPGTNDLIETGTVTHSQKTGWSSTSIDNYLDTGIALSAINSADISIGVVILSPNTSNIVSEFGAVPASGPGLGIVSQSSGNSNRPRWFSGSAVINEPLPTDGANRWPANGTFAISQKDGVLSTYRNGLKISQIANVPSALSSSTTLRLLRAGGQDAVATSSVGAAFIANRALTDAEQKELYAAVFDYIDCVRNGDPMIYPAGQGPRLVNADVVIYGTTLAGCVAAYHLAWRGYKVALVGEWNAETIWDLGGMLTSGLNLWDAKDLKTISLVAAEMAKHIAMDQRGSPTFGRTAAQLNLGPEYWSRAIRRMFDPSRTDGITLPGMNVPVYMTGGIVSAQKEGPRISSIRTQDGRVFRAPYFIEASYECDLVYHAGVPYVTGSPPSGPGLESISGWRPTLYNRPINQNGTEFAISPFRTVDLPASGLLPDLRRPPSLTVNGPDPAIQSMNYRVTSMKLPSGTVQGLINPWPSTPPRNYDSLRYEAAARLYAASTAVGVAINREAILADYALENGTTRYDLNNGGRLSTDMGSNGLDYGQAGADTTIRRRIAEDLRDYTLGFFYFHAFGGDARVPAGLVTEINNFGLDSRCHLDPSSLGVLHWGNRHYVRDPTFLPQNAGFRFDLNDYVQPDGTPTTKSSKTIADTSYRVDKHRTRLLAVGNEIRSQGGLGSGQIPGNADGGADTLTPLPYECVVPDKAVCENLLMTTGFSVSPLVWYSMRMEPVMATVAVTGAEAIHQAFQTGGALQDVDYPTLRAAIMALQYEGARTPTQPYAYAPDLKQVF